jgi:hypothetical protein
MTRIVGRLAAACVLCCTAARVDAQGPYAGVVGQVRDSGGRPIPGVELSFKGMDAFRARTDDSGGFRIMSLPAGPANLVIRRLGFAPAAIDVKLRAGQTDSLVIALTATATRIAGVTVVDEYEERSHRLLAGFWDRRSHGFGNFLTRDQIEKRDAHDFVDLARMLPSVNVQTKQGRPVIRFNRGGSKGDCPPQYFVDGMRIENGSPDEFTPQDIEALEFYSGPATLPPQFAPRPFSYTCGAVVIWTRIPG